MKRFVLFIISVFTQILLVAQTQNDYMDDDAVAGGANRTLNGIIIFICLIILAVVILFVLSIGAKIYYWFNPEANPEFKRKIAAKEKEEIRVKEKAVQDKKQSVLDGEKSRQKNKVDLGLSVMWADTNLFAKTIEDKGEKFAWGEIYQRTLFRYVDCFLNKKWSWDLNKILGNDELSICGITSFDAATFLWGECWRMPQMHEIKELLEKCEWEWTVIEGINGYKVKGQNGNFIFLPVTGENVIDEQKSIEAGFYWTGIASSNRNEAKFLFFNKNNKSAKENGQRWHGMAIRPVWSPKKKTTEEILSQLESNSTSPKKDYVSDKRKNDIKAVKAIIAENEFVTLKSIAEQTGFSIMKAYSITKQIGHKKKYPRSISKDKLLAALPNFKNQSSLAKHFHVSQPTICRLLNVYNIDYKEYKKGGI